MGGYNLEVYDDISRFMVLFILSFLPLLNAAQRLPVGAAGIFAGCCGVAGAVVGMAQVWYVGPIAAKLGPFGADLGFEVCLHVD